MMNKFNELYETQLNEGSVKIKLANLSKWHLNEIEKLSELVSVEYNKGVFVFFSGTSKGGQTELIPIKNGFIIKERYDSTTITDSDYRELTDFYNG
jgi:energy-coupling factor transporter ATP-binding protein EcfA2